MDVKTLLTLGLAALVLALGMVVHRRSLRQAPIHGGGLSAFFNFLSGACFVAIFPTVCVSVLALHPELVEVAGLTVNPLILIVVGLALGSLLSSLLFAIMERAPAEAAAAEAARRDSHGWTEEDARRSGL